MNCWSYRLQNLCQGARGRDSQPGKGLGPVLETVSRSLLQALQEGDNQGNGGYPRLTHKQCHLASEHVSKCGPKSFCPWCFKVRGNTKTTTNHLREVHYRLAIACDVYWLFASMSVQVVLEHQSRCRMKSHKKSKAKKQDEASWSQLQWVLQGSKMPKTFHPILPMNVDLSSHPSQVGLHSTIQTVIFSVT